MTIRRWMSMAALWPLGLMVGLATTVGASARDDGLAAAVDPPRPGRILKIIHGWPDAPEAQDSLIERLTRQGFGGVVCNVSFEQYLEDESRWAAFVRAVQKARSAGWSMWLYDERGYPSANAGGLVLRDHPEDEARGLLIAEAEATTPGAEITLERPPGAFVMAAAFPVVEGRIDATRGLDLAGLVPPQETSGTLRWSPPDEADAATPWRVMIVTEDRLYEGTHAVGNYHEKLPYPNLLDPEPTRRFIDLTYERGYAKHLGNDLGRYFEATFTDEPSLMSAFLTPMPYRVLPWSRHMGDEFAQRRGYDLEIARSVAHLAADTTDPGADGRLRRDFWLTVAELVSEHFFGQIQTWCQAHNIPSGGHLLAEENIVDHVAFYGDALRCYRRMDAPSIDCLTSVPGEVPWAVARRAASVAELTGKTLVMSETSDHGQQYRGEGDTRPVRVVTEAEIRGTINRQAVAGVNRITSYYTFNKLDDGALNRLNEWTGRLMAQLTGGHQVTDVAVVYPIESLWVRFVPSRHWTLSAQAARQIGAIDRATMDSLFNRCRDMTVIDAQAIVDSSVEAPGVLRHGDLAWRVVVLPGVDTLPLGAWERLRDFVRAGGIVVSLGPRPAHSETAFPDARVAAIAEEILGPFSPTLGQGPSIHAPGGPAGGAGVWLPAGSEPLLNVALDRLIEPDVAVREQANDPARHPLRATHRRIDGQEVYLIVNDDAEPWSGTVVLTGAAGPGQRLDLATGELHPVSDPRSVRLDLESYGASVLRFGQAATPPRHPASSGILTGLTLRRIAVTDDQPAYMGGEFVRSEVSPAARGDDPSAAWEVRSTLTRGDVDTFAFIEWTCEPVADLSRALGLLVTAEVPEGQATGSQLLLIVREQDGGDFYASTGLNLGIPGRQTALIPFDQLQLASWSKASERDGRLDTRRIAAIRVGWGGYFGKAGETISFRMALPQAGQVEP